MRTENSCVAVVDFYPVVTCETFDTAVCLLGVCAFRRRRVIRSLLLVFGTYILIGIANLIHGLVILKGLSERGIIGKTVYSVDSNEQLLNDLTEVTRANGDLFVLSHQN